MNPNNNPPKRYFILPKDIFSKSQESFLCLFFPFPIFSPIPKPLPKTKKIKRHLFQKTSKNVFPFFSHFSLTSSGLRGRNETFFVLFGDVFGVLLAIIEKKQKKKNFLSSLLESFFFFFPLSFNPPHLLSHLERFVVVIVVIVLFFFFFFFFYFLFGCLLRISKVSYILLFFFSSFSFFCFVLFSEWQMEMKSKSLSSAPMERKSSQHNIQSTLKF